jgi:hypothetical protein
MPSLTRILTLPACICLLMTARMPALAAPPDEIRIHVSPRGNDDWSGQLAVANAAATDGPVRTPAGALRALRALRASRPGLKGSITVLLHGGTYLVHQSVTVGRADGGNDSLNVRWAASAGERPILTGGTVLGNFREIARDVAAARIASVARGSVVASDLKEAGVTDFGAITARSSPGIELFFRGARMSLSRWPNDAWLKIAGVPQSGDTMLHPGLEREKRFDGVPAGRHYGRISYEGDRPARWSPENEITMHGYWTFDWSDSYQPVRSIDTARREIIIAPPYHGYGFTKNQRYYFLNILEELDTPGEWYLDRKRHRLYFWPPAPMREGDAVVSVLPGPLFMLDSCSHVEITGLTMECGRTTAVVIRGGSKNLIAGCTVRNMGGDAVLVDGGSDHRVQSCDISDMALGGITARGGDRLTLTPARHVLSNNHIHHFGNWVRTGCYAAILDGVGHVLEHNLIHDAPFEAIYLRGNDHLIEYNEVHRVTQETGDAGAFHTGRNWTWRGNVIRYNYFHDLKGPGLHGVMGVYLDDWACGFLVQGNVLYRAGRATLIGGGRDNIVDNNLYIECFPSVHLDARGLGWAGYYLDGTRTELFDQMKEVRYDAPPYSTRYPELARMYDGETGVPKYNRITRNISWGGRWMDVYDYLAFDLSVVEIARNIIADPDLLRRRKAGEQGWDPYYINIDLEEGYETVRQGDPRADELFARNRILPAPPAHFDPVRRTLTFTDPALPASIGFEPPPLNAMGLRKDAYRQTLP